MTPNQETRFQQRPVSFSATEEQERQAKKFNVHPLIIHLLAQRNVTGDEEVFLFLNPSLSNLPEPFTLSGMSKAAGLVADAIRNKDDIVIWGDYDVDGITSTCLLVQFFKSIGIEVSWYIPNRFTDGYGLNSKTIEAIRSNLKGENPLLITVDCGISNHGEILFAKKLGFFVIVTDHHEPPSDTVQADAVLNPKQDGCFFEDQNLAGVGVAFYLAAGIRSHLKTEGFFLSESNIPNLKQFLDYVAIGTIADMVPLTTVNRILVKAGFEILSSTSNIGLSALLKSSDIYPGTITLDDISFHLAPKINAAGRLGKVEAAMDLLLCSEEAKANTFANKLTDINNRRKKICENILETTLSISPNILISNNNCIIVSGEYHLGVLGIVASQLVNTHHVPTIIFSLDPSGNGQEILKGSGRSIPGINLVSILRKCDRYLIKYGGHAMAAGLSLHKENLDMFRECFSKILCETTPGRAKKEHLPVDAEFPLEKIFENTLLKQLNKLEPFGIGNTRPVFSDTTAYIYDYQVIGRYGDHLKIFFRGKYTNRQGIGFNLGHKRDILQKKRNHTVVFSPTINRYKSNVNWEVRLLDIL